MSPPPTVLRLNEPLRTYLEKRLGIPVELFVGANYAATGEALRFGRLDIAYLGPVTYILRSRAAKLEPFARPSHDVVGPTFQAAIIVPADSPAQSLKDRKGSEIAFGDPASTSGTWVPRYQLLEAGLVSGRDYTLRVLGAHDAVALAVSNHEVVAGGLSLPIYNRLLETTTYCPPTAYRSADLLSIPSALRRDGADFEALRLSGRRTGRHSAAGRLRRLHTRMDDRASGGAFQALS